MTEKKEIIVLGDVEMGGGTLTDDFISDNVLSQLIDELAQQENPLDLVFNGDTFDFLKCPIITSKIIYPRHITEEIALKKLELIYNAHKPVFESLSRLLKNKNKQVYFILGNHDFEIKYKKVQKRIKKLLKNECQVHFPGIKYIYKKVYVEHGQQYDYINKINLKQPFLIYNGKKILNMPWVSLGLISQFMKMKEKHPFMERIFPRNLLLKEEHEITKRIFYRIFGYLTKSLIYYPFRYYYDPTYLLPKGMLSEFYKRIKKVHWDVDDIMKKFKKKNKNKKKYQIYILGHIHEKYLKEENGKVFIHPGSWRDEYNLNKETGLLISREKNYVKILIEDNVYRYQIINMPHKRNPLKFTLVKKDELNHILLAAKNENQMNTSLRY